MIVIQSLQTGHVITEGDPLSDDVLLRQWTTGFYKTPVAGPVRLSRTGLDGDAVGSPQTHGGDVKAALCYATRHYDAWKQEHPDLDFGPGGFGENITIDGADEQSVCIGDQYSVGGCRIEVSQPRQPCWKISRRWGVKTLTKEVTQSGRTGWYVRVHEEGMIEAGNRMELIDRPLPQWTVARANDVLFGREVDRMAVIELMNLPQLSTEWKEALA